MKNGPVSESADAMTSRSFDIICSIFAARSCSARCCAFRWKVSIKKKVKKRVVARLPWNAPPPEHFLKIFVKLELIQEVQETLGTSHLERLPTLPASETTPRWTVGGRRCCVNFCHSLLVATRPQFSGICSSFFFSFFHQQKAWVLWEISDKLSQKYRTSRFTRNINDDFNGGRRAAPKVYTVYAICVRTTREEISREFRITSHIVSLCC